MPNKRFVFSDKVGGGVAEAEEEAEADALGGTGRDRSPVSPFASDDWDDAVEVPCSLEDTSDWAADDEDEDEVGEEEEEEADDGDGVVLELSSEGVATLDDEDVVVAGNGPC